LFEAKDAETRIPLDQLTELAWHTYFEDIGPGQLAGGPLWSSECGVTPARVSGRSTVPTIVYRWS
jgi:hypothetical protein